MQNFTGRFMSALLVDTVDSDRNRIESLTQRAKWFQLAIDYLNPVYTRYNPLYNRLYNRLHRVYGASRSQNYCLRNEITLRAPAGELGYINNRVALLAPSLLTVSQTVSLTVLLETMISTYVYCLRYYSFSLLTYLLYRGIFFPVLSFHRLL